MAKTTIAFNENADAELNGIAQNLGLSKADVVRRALSLYAYVIDTLQKDPTNQLAVVQTGAENKIQNVIHIPGIRAAASVSGR